VKIALLVFTVAPVIALPAQTLSELNAMSELRLRERLGFFSDDRFSGRVTGTAGYDAAASALAGMLRLLPVAGGGARGEFEQAVPIVRRHSAHHKATLAVIGAPPRVQAGIDRLAYHAGEEFVPLRGFAGIPFMQSADVRGKVVFGGRLGEPSKLDSVGAVGRIVILQPRARADGLPDYQVWHSREALQEYASAAAILIASLDVTPTGVRARLLGDEWELNGQQDQSVGLPPVALISRIAASSLLYHAIDAAAPGHSAGIEARLAFTTETERLDRGPRNLIAKIEGSDPALRSEVVVISARLDRVGTRKGQGSEDDDPVFDGANDGTGAIALLAIAEHIALQREKPRRSIVFLWTVGEEQGLLGSQWFVEHFPFRTERIIASINVDRIGPRVTNNSRDTSVAHVEIVGAGAASAGLLPLLTGIVGADRAALRSHFSFPDGSASATTFCDGDHWSFAKKGVPGIRVSADAQPGYSRTSGDAVTIDFARYSLITQLISALATGIAGSSEIAAPDDQVVPVRCMR
jgi:hypothetical protein